MPQLLRLEVVPELLKLEVVPEVLKLQVVLEVLRLQVVPELLRLELKLCRRFSSCAGGRRQECGVSLLLQKPAFPSFLPSGGETSIGRSTF